MGKKGDLLRAQKAQNTTYTFTAAQLQEHDDFINKGTSGQIQSEDGGC